MKNTEETYIKSEFTMYKKFLKLIFDSKFPWIPYLGTMFVHSVMMALYAILPKYEAMIGTGEVFNQDGLILKYCLISIGVTLCFIPVTAYKTFVSELVMKRNRSAMWNKCMRLPLKVFDKIGPTTVVTRVLNDVEAINSTMKTITGFVSVFSVLSTSFVILISISVKLFLCVLIPYLMAAGVEILSTKVRGILFEKVRLYQSKLTSYFSQRLSKIKLTKSNGSSTFEYKQGCKYIDEYYKSDLKNQVVFYSINSVETLIKAMSGILFYIVGGKMLAEQTIDMANFTTFQFTYLNVVGVIFRFFTIFVTIRIAMQSARVITELNALEPEKVKAKVGFDIPDEDIEFNNVCFSYDSEREILKNLSFKIEKGKTTAIVGESGSGKTTVLRLLERLYEINDGSIKFGKRNIEDIHLDEWRKNIGYVVQGSPLVLGTIRDNIEFGLDREISDDELNKIIKDASLDFIDTLPDGLNTDTGELGGRLSGGQMQRIAIARAIAKRSNYLFLDEPTANLDNVNSVKVTDAISKLMEGKTVVVVAHNMKTIMSADKIIVMDKGCVVAEGKHDTLYASNNIYKKYIDIQLDN